MNSQEFRASLAKTKTEIIEILAFEAMDYGHCTGGMMIDLAETRTPYYDNDNDPIDAWCVVGVSLMGAHVSGPLVPKGHVMDFNDLTTEQLIDTLEAVEKYKETYAKEHRD